MDKNSKWIDSKVEKPKHYGLYLVTDGYSWYIKIINKGVILKYDDWDDGYSVDSNWIDRDWFWQELPNRPDGETPYFD